MGNEIPKAGRHNEFNFTSMQGYLMFLTSALQGVLSNPANEYHNSDEIAQEALVIADAASFYFHSRLMGSGPGLPGPDDIHPTDTFEEANAAYRQRVEAYEQTLATARETLAAEAKRQETARAAVEEQNVVPFASADRVKLAEIKAALEPGDPAFPPEPSA